MRIRFTILFIAILLLGSKIGNCQTTIDSVKVYRIETFDGNVFTGKLVSEDSLNILIRSDNYGTITILKSNIKNSQAIKETAKVNGAYWFPNPQSARYFWAPNGYGLKKGEAYYQNIWVFYNQVSVGVTDHFSMGAGMMPFFLLGGWTPVWIVPKFSFPVIENKFNVGTGAFIGTILGEQSGFYGLIYGTATIGSRDKNLTIGLADGFAGDNWMKFPLINLNGIVRIGPKGYIISENYFLSVDRELSAFLSIGGRSIIKNISLDYSLWFPVISGMNRLVATPFLGFTIPIGSKKK